MSPRDWRPITWLLIVFTVAMAIWFVATLREQPAPFRSRTCEDAGEARAVCELEGDAQALDPGPMAILVLWMGGAALLAVVWWVTNRDIPHRRIWLVVKTVIGLASAASSWSPGSSGTSTTARSPGRSRHCPTSRSTSPTTHLTPPGPRRPTRTLRDGVITLLVPRSTGVEDASINGRLYQMLPSGLRAEGPDEVSMVVRTECWWAGHLYMNNIGASSTYYECQCEVGLVDLAASPPTVVEVDRQFGTGDLPENITAGRRPLQVGLPLARHRHLPGSAAPPVGDRTFPGGVAGRRVGPGSGWCRMPRRPGAA